MLDNYTLAIVASSMWLFSAVAVSFLWLHNQSQVVTRFWAIATWSQCVAYILFPLNEVLPDWVSKVLSNHIAAIGNAIALFGTLLFVNADKRWQQSNWFAVTLWVVGFNFFYFVDDQPLLRTLLWSSYWAFTASCYFWLGRQLTKSSFPMAASMLRSLALVIMLTALVNAIVASQYSRVAEFNSGLLTTISFASNLLIPFLVSMFCYLLVEEHRQQRSEAQRVKAEQDAALKSQFLSTLSHEIRTPLHGIMGSAQLLLNMNADAKHQHYCESMIHSVDQLNKLIDNVLNYTKLQQKQIKLQPEDTDINTWVDQIHSIVMPLTEQKQLKLDVEIDPSTAQVYYFDNAKVRQVLLNLLSNAVKFTEQGSIQLSIKKLATLDEHHHLLGFAVEDSGVGISLEEQHNIFEPFTQARAGQLLGGSGLGLAICQQLLNAMGSELKLESELHQGSCFRFQLPVELGDADLLAFEQQQLQPTTSLKILLIEDLPLNQRIAIEMLSIDGHKVTLAENCAQATVKLAEGPFDLIIADINLPDGYGDELCRMLRASEGPNQQTPVLGFTATLTHDSIKRFLAAGMYSVVGKPLKIETLRQAIARYDVPPPTLNFSDDSAPILQLDTLNQVKELLGDDDFLLQISQFRALAEQYLQQANHALQQGDIEHCRFQLHRLASVAGQLGLVKLSTQTRNFEQQEPQRWPKDLTKQLKQAIVESDQALRRAIAEKSS